jgi:hypothetical protein
MILNNNNNDKGQIKLYKVGLWGEAGHLLPGLKVFFISGKICGFQVMVLSQRSDLLPFSSSITSLYASGLVETGWTTADEMVDRMEALSFLPLRPFKLHFHFIVLFGKVNPFEHLCYSSTYIFEYIYLAKNLLGGWQNG